MTGSEFLVAYGIALLAALIWVASRGGKTAATFERERGVTLEDPYEIAFLAGGAPRVTQLAALSLIASGHARWIAKFTGHRLAAIEGAPPNGRIVSDLWHQIRTASKKGVAASQLTQLVAPAIPPIEVKLASLGLRPTQSERTSAIYKTVCPLIALAAIGAARIAYGVTREKPVGFLIIGVVLTLILAVAFGSRGGRLTAAGKQLLDQLRETHRDRRTMRFSTPSSHLPEIALGVALFGPAAVADIAGLGEIQRHLSSQLGSKSGGSDGGCGTSGCSSGCSSGCGGGGCGGCGD